MTRSPATATMPRTASSWGGSVCRRCRMAPTVVSGHGTRVRSASGIHRPFPGARVPLGQHREGLLDREREPGDARGERCADALFRGTEELIDQGVHRFPVEGRQADRRQTLGLAGGRDDDEQRCVAGGGGEVGEQSLQPRAGAIGVVDVQDRRPPARRDLDQPAKCPADVIGIAGSFQGDHRGEVRHHVGAVGLALEQGGEASSRRLRRRERAQTSERLHDRGQGPPCAPAVSGGAPHAQDVRGVR